MKQIYAQNRVRAVIIEDGNIVVLEINKKDDHYWCFPGGGVEEGETEIQALERECLEEVNISVKVGEKIWYQDFKGYPINFYQCKILNGKMGPGNGPEYQENNDYIGTRKPDWLPLKDLKNYDLRPNELRDKIIN